MARGTGTLVSDKERSRTRFSSSPRTFSRATRRAYCPAKRVTSGVTKGFPSLSPPIQLLNRKGLLSLGRLPYTLAKASSRAFTTWGTARQSTVGR